MWHDCIHIGSPEQLQDYVISLEKLYISNELQTNRQLECSHNNSQKMTLLFELPA